MTMIKYFESEDLKVLTVAGFIERYEKELKRHRTRLAAYDATERVYISIVGVPRYHSINAFRMALCRQRKKTSVKL